MNALEIILSFAAFIFITYLIPDLIIFMVIYFFITEGMSLANVLAGMIFLIIIGICAYARWKRGWYPFVIIYFFVFIGELLAVIVELPGRIFSAFFDRDSYEYKRRTRGEQCPKCGEFGVKYVTTRRTQVGTVWREEENDVVQVDRGWVTENRKKVGTVKQKVAHAEVEKADVMRCPYCGYEYETRKRTYTE